MTTSYQDFLAAKTQSLFVMDEPIHDEVEPISEMDDEFDSVDGDVDSESTPSAGCPPGEGQADEFADL